MMNSNYFPSSKLLFIIISKYNIYLIIIPSKLIFSFLHLFLYSNIITFLTIYPFYKNSTLQNKNFKMPIFLKNHAKGSRRKERFPTKPRSRSVPDVAVLNSPFRFLRNRSLSTNVFQGASFGNPFFPSLVYNTGKFIKQNSIYYNILTCCLNQIQKHS